MTVATTLYSFTPTIPSRNTCFLKRKLLLFLAPKRPNVAKPSPAEAHQHNLTQSHLYKLPPELILLIADHLPSGCASLSLQASGVKFRAALGARLPKWKPEEIEFHEREMFRHLLCLDELEKDWADRPPYQVCAGCEAVRSNLVFPDPELRVTMKEKVTRRIPGRFPLCEHAAYGIDSKDIGVVEDRRYVFWKYPGTQHLYGRVLVVLVEGLQELA